MPRRLRLWLAPVLVPALVATAFFASTGSSSSAPKGLIKNKVIARELAIERGQVKREKWRMPVSSGVMYPILQAAGDIDRRIEAAGGPTAPTGRSSLGTQGCHVVRQGVGSSNIRVNQDCSLRRQAEEVIAVNPTNPRNLIAGQNDSRVGFNHCGYDWSFDGGATWGDQIPPFFQYQFSDGRVPDVCSDPTAAFDSDGNAYAGGIVFTITSDASAVVVAKSNAPIGGAFYHTPVRGPFQTYLDLPLGVVASDVSDTIFHDKELMTADAHPRSPKADNVYMTWTRFDFDTGEGVGAHSPIYFSQSTNGGATWSRGVEISGSNGQICTVFSGESDPDACDQDQGSFPVVGPDGTVYVVFGNGNTPLVGINQVLFVKCPATEDCSDPASWTTPVKVNDLIDNHPTGPDPATGCPAGRQCLPPNGYRVPEFTSMSISVDDGGNLYTVWSDFRNGGGNCMGPATTATPPCNNDVFYSFSTDGGATWSGATNVTPPSEFGKSAQWQPGSQVQPDGRSLWVGFYDRRYGNCENTGCNDITLAEVRNPTGGAPTFSYTRLTVKSMPNLIPANNPAQAGFLGDYMWVAAPTNTDPFVVWADTRGRARAVEEDVYFAR